MSIRHNYSTKQFLCPCPKAEGPTTGNCIVQCPGITLPTRLRLTYLTVTGSCDLPTTPLVLIYGQGWNGAIGGWGAWDYNGGSANGNFWTFACKNAATGILGYVVKYGKPPNPEDVATITKIVCNPFEVDFSAPAVFLGGLCGSITGKITE